MPKSIQFKKLLLLMLLFSSSTNVFSQQIQKDYIKNQWQDSRYINNNDGTVTDKKTALMWKQCPEGFSGSGCSIGDEIWITYKEAIERAKNSTFADHNDWRLPNIKELASLVARDRSSPAINSVLFPKTPYSFWSSSPSAYSAYNAWVMTFDLGYENDANRGDNNFVRLVRGGE